MCPPATCTDPRITLCVSRQHTRRPNGPCERTRHEHVNRAGNPEGPAPSPAHRTFRPGSPTRSPAATSTPASVRLHAVIGGDGPPLLLVHGWPETWYAWRLVMPALARDFQVIAVDQRGIGLSDKPQTGYDTGTLADDLVGADGRARPRAVRRGRPRHRLRDRLRAGRGPPGPRRARRARRDPRAPRRRPRHRPLFVPAPINDRLWHIPFNRVEKLPEQLIAGREDVYFGYEFAIQGGVLPDDVDRLLRRSPLRPRLAARQPRVLPGLRRHPRAERPARERAAADARAGDRRRGELRRSRRARR